MDGITRWDGERVRALADTVPVRLAGGRVVACPIAGWACTYAVVWLPDGGRVEAAWETLAHILNTGSALHM